MDLVSPKARAKLEFSFKEQALAFSLSRDLGLLISENLLSHIYLLYFVR